MGGMSIAAVGYDVTEALENHMNQHNMTSGVSSFKHILQRLEAETAIPMSLARFDDLDRRSCMFLCCYVDYRVRLYDCEELMAVMVPQEFTRVKEVLHFNGEVRRVFGSKGIIFSYDSNGETRVKEHGLAI
jgi:hypothetical protein